MKYKVVPTNKFKKEYKLALKRGKKIEKLHEVVELLAKDLELPASLCDHELKGNWKNHRELHNRRRLAPYLPKNGRYSYLRIDENRFPF